MNQIVLKDKVGEFGARLKVLARGLERARQLRMKEVASRDALVNYLLNNVELIQALADSYADLDKENTNLERELVSLERDLRELKRATFVPSATSGANHTSESEGSDSEPSSRVTDEELLCGAERSGAKSVRDTESDASADALAEVPDTKVTTRNKSHAAKKSVKEV